MSFEQPENGVETLKNERREELKEELGIAFSAKQKMGGTASIESQIRIAEEMNVATIQFDFRNRETEEIEQSEEALLAYRERYPDVRFSIHGDTPKIDEQTLEIKNKEKIEKQLQVAQYLSSESYTIHPPSVNQKVFEELPLETKEKIISNYVDILAQAIKKSFDDGIKFSVAIENMPTKGEDGAWGQKIEDVLLLLREIEKKAVEKGVNPDVVKDYVGATLDVNHALHAAAHENFIEILEPWFRELGDYLRVVHLYAPREADEKFIEKHKIALDFASKFNPNARLFIESKQTPEITGRLYFSAKGIE